MVSRGHGKSPIAVRTRFNGKFVNIQDLQLQLNRDLYGCPSQEAGEYIQGLIDRLDGIKE